MEIGRALDKLRDMLRSMKATGADGFEGLCATCIAHRSGLAMRLARSGLQLGRDASSPSSEAFAISLECKRYSDPLGLDDLIGKVASAAQDFGGNVDLWVLGATSELGDLQERKLSKELTGRGMTLLTLDWCPRPLPPLAVLLAATKRAVLAWSDANPGCFDRGVLAACLDAVLADPAYPDADGALGASLAPAEIGLGALQREASAWLRARLRDPGLSRRTFNQRIVPAWASASAIHRNDLCEALSAALATALSRQAVVAILGGEGSGKTWLVAQWWATEPVSPIMILVAGRRIDLLDPSSPVNSIANLLAQQHGSGNHEEIAGWRRRLARWRLPNAGPTLRFVIVLDGLNERAAFPWSDILAGLSAEAALLGGVVAVTSRREYWRRNVLSRLFGTETIEVAVAGFSDAELDRILVDRGVVSEDVPMNVRTFIRNPRVCAVALDLLGRLAGTPQELSVDRLLLEYWRFKIDDRGDLVAHGVEEFHALLRSHASAWLKVPGRKFERDDWAMHSGLAKRAGVSIVKDDLTEIEEGRFLSAAPGSSGFYEFQADALPFALGLLLVEELRNRASDPEHDPDAVLSSILDPVQAFDRIGSVLSASMCLACLDDDFPELGRRAILRAWFGLQNVDLSAFESMAANVPSRPHTFLDYAQLRVGGLGMSRADSSLTGLLVCHRRHARVSRALADTLPRWLGRWSKVLATRIPGADGELAQARRTVDIERRLSELGDAEAGEFRELTIEGEFATELLLDRTAAALIAGLRQEQFAVGMVAWALARALDHAAPNGDDELAWAVRLNLHDFPAVRAAVHALVDRLEGVFAASWTRGALAGALRLLGDPGSSARADQIKPLTPGGRAASELVLRHQPPRSDGRTRFQSRRGHCRGRARARRGGLVVDGGNPRRPRPGGCHARAGALRAREPRDEGQ